MKTNEIADILEIFRALSIPSMTQAVGVSSDHIYRICSGKRGCSPGLKKKILKYAFDHALQLIKIATTETAYNDINIIASEDILAGDLAFVDPKTGMAKKTNYF